jgi:hypothetical protein
MKMEREKKSTQKKTQPKKTDMMETGEKEKDGGGGMDKKVSEPIAPVQAVRLIFEYEGNKVKLISQQPVDVAITGFDLPRVQRSGNFIDVRDAEDRTLAQVPIRDGFQTTAEIFPENPGEPFTRVDVKEPRGAFTVVVPAPKTADHVMLTRVDPKDITARAQASLAPDQSPRLPVSKVIASFPLLHRDSSHSGGEQP